jgi:TP901 family phage tail tape measure protein
MILVVRSQDFASRNLHRIGQEMGKLNRIQQAVRSQQLQAIDTQRKLDRVQDLGKERRRLALARRMANAQGALSEVTKELADAQAAAKRSMPLNQVATAQARVRHLERRQRQLTDAIKDHDKSMQTLPSRYRRLVGSAADLDEAWEKNRKNLKRARFEARLAAEDYERLTAAADPRRLRAMRLAEMSHAAGRAGRVAQLGGLVGTAALGMAAASAARQDTALTRAATQAPDTLGRGFEAVNAQADRFRVIVNDAMGDFPATADEMADALYNIFSSLDVTEDKGVDLFRMFNKLAVASGVELPEAVNAGISVLEDFKGAQDNVNATLNRMMAIVRFGRLDLAGFNTMLAKVGPAAAGANQSLDDVGGAMAFLATRAISPARGSTQLARLVQVFSDRDFIRGLRKAGVEITDANGQLISFDQIIEKIAKRWPELQKGEGVRDFFQIFTAAGRGKGRGREFTIEAQRAFTFLMTGLDRYRQLQSDILADNDEFARSYAAMAESSNVQWESFMNNAKRGVLALGEAAIPAFAEIGKVIGKAVDWWNQLSPATQNAIGKTLTYVAVGSLLLGILGSLIGFLGSGIAKLATFALGADLAAAASRRLLFALRALSLIGTIVITIKILQDKGLPEGIPGAKWLNKQMGTGASGKAEMDKNFWNTFFGDEGKWSAPWKKSLSTIGKSSKQLRQQFLDNMASLSAEDREVIRQNLYRIEADERAAFIRRLAQTEAFYRYKKVLEETNQPGKAAKVFAIPGTRPDEGTRGAGRVFRPTAKEAQASGKSIQWFAKQYDKMLKELNEGGDKGADDARRLFETIRDAGEQAAQQLKSAADRLAQLHAQMREANQAAFGELFQGPLLESEAFDLAKEWGIEPQIDHLIRDMNMQANRFKKWRSGLDTLMKKGMPAGLLEELQSMGIEGMPFIETLINASPGKLKEFIQGWSRGQKLIDEATDIDFKKKMDKWRSYGKGIMQNIILGMQSEEVAMTKYFENWLNNEFPGYVKAMQEKARKEFMDAQNAGKAKDKPKTTPKSGAAQNTGNTTTHNDNSITVNAQGKDNKELARDVAWKVKNARRLPPGLRKHPDRR